MLKQKIIKNRICSLILVDDFNNINFDAYYIRFEDLFQTDFDEIEKYWNSHFWELEDGTFA